MAATTAGISANGQPTGALPPGASVTMGGDVSGQSSAATVVAEQGNPFETATYGPGDAGKTLTWDGTKWVAQSPAFSLQISPVFDTAPTLPGQLYYASGPNHVDLAVASSAATCDDLRGVWIGTAGKLAAIEGLPIPVRFPPGLTLVNGQPFFVHPTSPGLATNVQPSVGGQFVKVGGYIDDASTYDTMAMTGSTAVCHLDPTPVFGPL